MLTFTLVQYAFQYQFTMFKMKIHLCTDRQFLLVKHMVVLSESRLLCFLLIDFSYEVYLKIFQAHKSYNYERVKIKIHFSSHIYIHNSLVSLCSCFYFHFCLLALFQPFKTFSDELFPAIISFLSRQTVFYVNLPLFIARVTGILHSDWSVAVFCWWIF